MGCTWRWQCGNWLIHLGKCEGAPEFPSAVVQVNEDSGDETLMAAEQQRCLTSLMSA